MKIMKKTLLVFALLCLAACGEPVAGKQVGSNQTASGVVVEQESASDAVGGENISEQFLAELDFPESVVSASEPAQPDAQAVVKASLNFQTDNVTNTERSIKALAKKHNGMVTQSHIKNDNSPTYSYTQADGNILKVNRYGRSAQMTVRIPRHSVGLFLDDIQKHIVFLGEQQFSAKDITLDLRRQAMIADRRYQQRSDLVLQNSSDNGIQEAVRPNVASDAQPASATDEMNAPIVVPAPVVNLTSNWKQKSDFDEINRKYWQNQIDFATITIQFDQPEGIHKQTYPNPEVVVEQQKIGFNAMIAPMFKQGWSGFLGVVLFFIGIWPLALGVPLLWLGWKRWQQSGSNVENEEFPPADFVPRGQMARVKSRRRKNKEESNIDDSYSYFDDDEDDY